MDVCAKPRTRNLEVVDDRVGVTVVPEESGESLDPVPVFRAYPGHHEVDVVVPGVRDRLDGVVVRIDFAPWEQHIAVLIHSSLPMGAHMLCCKLSK